MKRGEYSKTKEFREAQSQRMLKSNPFKGKTHTKENREKIRLAHLGKKVIFSAEHRKNLSGKNSGNWKGGVTPLYKKIRMSYEYKLWREAIFKRDNYTCIWCFRKGGWNKEEKKQIILNADHIKRFSDYPELRFAIDNGRTLCEDCHRTTETYGNKKRDQ